MKTPSQASPPWPAAQALDVDAGHRLWWCEGGDPQGHAVLVLHGGPGGASRPETVRWFEGMRVRWIVFDQRGCGRSTPAGSTVANDLAALVADAEALRVRLGIERWSIVGGSWGARVALALACARPRRIGGLFLRSPFLGSLDEASRYVASWEDWLGEDGRRWLGPERAQGFKRLFQPGMETLALESRPLGNDELLARAWSAYDDAQSAPGGVPVSGCRFDSRRLPAATLALRASWQVHAHYAATRWSGSVQTPQPWQFDAVAPAGLPELGPITIVWGEADATCDPAMARALAGRWPTAWAVGVPGAGHRLGDARLAPVLAEHARRWSMAL